MRKASSLILTLSGCIDEWFELSAHLADLAGASRVLISAAKVSRINSSGVRTWIKSLSKIPDGVQIVFSELSVHLVEQANLIPNFLPRGQVLSFFAPYLCPQCQTESQHCLRYPEDFPEGSPIRQPSFDCTECKVPLEFDDLEEEYFLFLQGQHRDQAARSSEEW